MRKRLGAVGLCLAIPYAISTAFAAPLTAAPAQSVVAGHGAQIELVANRCIRCQDRCYARFSDDLDRYGVCKLRCKGSYVCTRRS